MIWRRMGILRYQIHLFPPFDAEFEGALKLNRKILALYPTRWQAAYDVANLLHKTSETQQNIRAAYKIFFDIPLDAKKLVKIIILRNTIWISKKIFKLL